MKELAEQFDDKNVAIVRSYINKKKITEDVLEALKQAAQYVTIIYREVVPWKWY